MQRLPTPQLLGITVAVAHARNVPIALFLSITMLYFNPSSVISTPLASPIQRMLLHLNERVSTSRPRPQPPVRSFFEDVPNQHQTQGPSVLSINELLRIPQQNIHVRVDALQDALVLGLAPFQADDDLSADSISKCQFFGCKSF